MSRLWVKVIKRHRIDRHEAMPCAWGEHMAALRELSKGMDLPEPMWLSKHEKEFEQYGKTSFLPDHFVESVDFERLEVEFLDDTDKKKTSRDPRNAF